MKTKISNNTFDFDKTFLFKGSEILYPLLAIFCLFFYFAFFGQGMEFQKLNSETPNWPFWFILACISFGLINIWCYQKKYISKRSIVINTSIFSLSFFMIEYNLYHILFPLIYAEILISFYCACKLFKTPKKIKQNIIWLSPICYIGLYLLYPTMNEVIISTLIFLGLITFYECKHNKSIRIILVFSIIITYIITELAYCPYNPLLFIKNIQSINMSFNPRGTSLVTKDGNKYAFVNGWSLNGEKLINAEFDTISSISPFITQFGGLKVSNKHDIQLFQQIPSELFPIIVRDNIVYFSSQKSVYDVLKDSVLSEDTVASITAKMFFDYVDLCCNNDSIQFDLILKDSHNLQNHILKSLDTNRIKREFQTGAEKTLRDVSKEMSLGMLNALSMDLLLCGDYTSAIKIFSYQFFLTFYDTDIYKQINTNFNINLSKTFGSIAKISQFQLKDADLKMANTFEPWTQIYSMSVTFAEILLVHNYKAIQEETIEQLKELLVNKQSINPFDTTTTIKLKQDLDKIFQEMSEYKNTPNLVQYTSSIQSFLYSCVLSNVYPDYNSYFLNRFNEVSPMVPLNPLSESAYNEFRNLYNSRFDEDIKQVKEIATLLYQLDELIDTSLSIQYQIAESLNGLKIDEKSKSIIKDALIKNTKTKINLSHK